jgi:hypothetical protein
MASRGFAVSPDGSVTGKTSAEEPVFAFDPNPGWARGQKGRYPSAVHD